MNNEYFPQNQPSQNGSTQATGIQITSQASGSSRMNNNFGFNNSVPPKMDSGENSTANGFFEQPRSTLYDLKPNTAKENDAKNDLATPNANPNLYSKEGDNKGASLNNLPETGNVKGDIGSFENLNRNTPHVVSSKNLDKNLHKIEVKKTDFQDNLVGDAADEKGKQNGDKEKYDIIDKLDTNSSINSADQDAKNDGSSAVKKKGSEDLIEINNYNNTNQGQKAKNQTDASTKNYSHTYRESSEKYMPKSNPYEVKLDNRLDQRLDYYRNSSKIPGTSQTPQPDLSSHEKKNPNFSDRGSADPFKPSLGIPEKFSGGQKKNSSSSSREIFSNSQNTNANANAAQRKNSKLDWLEKFDS